MHGSHNDWEGGPLEKEEGQGQEEPEQEQEPKRRKLSSADFPLCNEVIFVVRDAAGRQLVSPSVADLKLLMSCRPWQASGSVPAKPGQGSIRVQFRSCTQT